MKRDAGDPRFSPEQQLLAAPIFSGYDTYKFCADWRQEKEYQELYCLYVLEKVLRNRARIVKNNSKLAVNPDVEARDQGFTRPQTLILAPFRNTALQIIKTLQGLWATMGGQVDNEKRLGEEFGPSEDDLEADRRRDSGRQPENFKHTFRGNIDDCFRVGIKCTRSSLKLFCDFYSADIIVASPLGLKLVAVGQTETKSIRVAGMHSKKRRVGKKADSDFLSSIQLLIVDQADIIAMQNWEHLVYIAENLNKIPKASHGCDFSRVKTAFLDGLASHTRQNLIFSKFIFPDLNALSKSFVNCTGSWKCFTSNHTGYLKKANKVRPVFHHIESLSPSEVPEARLKYFIEKILPPLVQAAKGVCIFIASYLDFVQVREHFQKSDLSYAVLSEYCTPKEVSRSRSQFSSGDARFLLITERFHFFNSLHVRGIRNLIFYSLPDHAEYFLHWCDLVESQLRIDLPVLISQYDYLQVERIVGTKHVKTLLG